MADMHKAFNAKLHKIMKTKNKNSSFLTKKKYNDLIKSVNSIKDKTSGKKPEEYQRLKRYDVIKVDNVDKLIYPTNKDSSNVRFYVYFEEIFAIIHEKHLSIGHGGRNKMLKELQIKYKNITTEEVVLYLNLCETCKKKTKCLGHWKNQLKSRARKKSADSLIMGGSSSDNLTEFEARALAVFGSISKAGEIDAPKFLANKTTLRSSENSDINSPESFEDTFDNSNYKIFMSPSISEKASTIKPQYTPGKSKEIISLDDVAAKILKLTEERHQSERKIAEERLEIDKKNAESMLKMSEAVHMMASSLNKLCAAHMERQE